MMKPADTLHARTKAFAKDHTLKSWWCVLSTTFFLVLASVGTLPGLGESLPLRVFCSVLTGLFEGLAAGCGRHIPVHLKPSAGGKAPFVWAVG